MAAHTASPPHRNTKPTLDDLLAGNHRPTASVPLCLRADLQEQFDDLQAQLQAARKTRGAMLTEGTEAQKLAEQITALTEEMSAAVVDFRLRAMPRREYVALRKRHPSSSPRFAFDADTMGPELVRLSVTSPELTDDQWGRLLGNEEHDGVLTDGQLSKLVNRAFELNSEDPQVPLSQLASTLMRGSAAS